jgi:hypothetical protein
MAKNKFEFGVDFQELILKYTVTEQMGFKALELYDDTYFATIHHAIIAYALKKYYKKFKRIPEEPYLRESLRTIYSTERAMKLNLNEEDKSLVESTITKLYNGKVSEPGVIIEKCINFARYVKFKEELEQIDIEHYDSYEGAISKLQKANTVGLDLQQDYGTFVVGGIMDRAHKRDIIGGSRPTPFWQVNNLLNGGGTTTGSVMVVMSKEKRFKTGFMINTAIGYMKMRKKVFYLDLENGQIQITTRTEQSMTNQTQDTISSGDYDSKIIKLMRKYKRIGAELAIKKFPSLQTTMAHAQKWVDDIKRDFGITFDAGIIDYGPLLGSISGKNEEFDRISDAFLDIKNFSDHNKLDAIWTAAHITREGNKRIGTKFQSTDIAKCIDIPRHIDALLGLQENEEEMEAGVMRLEVIEQRNGMRDGKALFWVDIPRQRLREFSKIELRRYAEQAEAAKTIEKKSDL